MRGGRAGAGPHLNTAGTQAMDLFCFVEKGAAMLASPLPTAMPVCAARIAPQSFAALTIHNTHTFSTPSRIYCTNGPDKRTEKRRGALPSPHMATSRPIDCRPWISCFFWSGSIRANTAPRRSTCTRVAIPLYRIDITVGSPEEHMCTVQYTRSLTLTVLYE